MNKDVLLFILGTTTFVSVFVATKIYRRIVRKKRAEVIANLLFKNIKPSNKKPSSNDMILNLLKNKKQ